jgi:hypothetical protein
MDAGSSDRLPGTGPLLPHLGPRTGPHASRRPDPTQRPRLEEIVANLRERLAEARERGWFGEVEGIEVSIAGAEDKLARMTRLVGLGMPTIRS